MRTGHAGILALALAACGPSVGQDGGGAGGADAGGGGGGGADAAGGGGGGGEDCDESIDVLLVLDVSSSMGFVLDDLQADIDGVVTATNAVAPGADAHFGLLSFADNGALDTTGDLEGGVVHSQAATLIDAFKHVKATYTNHDRNPGDGPSGPTFQNPICEENALDALHAAATDFPWRENSAHVVILATDDTFLERPDNYGDGDGDGEIEDFQFPPEGDYPAAWTVPETVTALTGAGIRVFSFSALTPISGCSTNRRMNASDVSDGWSTSYGASAPIPDSTDGRNFDLAAVEDGTISLADTINDVVVESHCNPVD